MFTPNVKYIFPIAQLHTESMQSELIEMSISELLYTVSKEKIEYKRLHLLKNLSGASGPGNTKKHMMMRTNPQGKHLLSVSVWSVHLT